MSVHHCWGAYPGERFLSDVAVAARSLDVEETPIGFEADLLECREIMEPFADTEVVGVVDGGLGAEGLSLLVVLLDLRSFVVDVQ